MRTAAGMSSAGRPSSVRAGDVGTEPVDELREVVDAELVAAGVDAGAEHRPHRRLRVSKPDGVDAGTDDAGEQAGPARVHDTHRVARAERDRGAVGGEHDEGEPGHRRDGGIGFRPVGRRGGALGGAETRASGGRPGERHDPGAVHLTQPRPPVGVGQREAGREAAPVLGHGHRIVTDVVTEVQCAVGRPRDAAVAVGEDDPDGPDPGLDARGPADLSNGPG